MMSSFFSQTEFYINNHGPLLVGEAFMLSDGKFRAYLPALSIIVFTPRRYFASHVVWSSLHDFSLMPRFESAVDILRANFPEVACLNRIHTVHIEADQQIADVATRYLAKIDNLLEVHGNTKTVAYKVVFMAGNGLLRSGYRVYYQWQIGRWQYAPGKPGRGMLYAFDDYNEAIKFANRCRDNNKHRCGSFVICECECVLGQRINKVIAAPLMRLTRVIS